MLRLKRLFLGRRPIRRMIAELNSKRAVLIDVREIEERLQGAIANAVHLPFSCVGPHEWQTVVPADRKVYIHCASGRRAARVARYLKDHPVGVVSIDWSVRELHNAGLPLLDE